MRELFSPSVSWVEISLKRVSNDITTISSNFVKVNVCNDTIQKVGSSLFKSFSQCVNIECCVFSVRIKVVFGVIEKSFVDGVLSS